MMDRPIEKKLWTPKRIVYVSAGAVFIIFVIYSIFAMSGGPKLNVKSERLTISTVIHDDFQERLSTTGSVIPLNTYYLDAVEEGRVDNVYLEAGAFVKKGDVILELVNTKLLMDIMYREAETFQQSNNLRNTRLNMERNGLEMKRELLDLEHRIKQQRRIVETNVSLETKNLISDREFEESKDELDYLIKKLELTKLTNVQDSTFRTNQLEQLEISLTRMEMNLEIVKKNLDNLIIKAPISGHLTALNTEVGQLKKKGERLGQIDVLDGFKMRVPVDEYYISRIALGQSGSFEFNDNEYKLMITKIYPEVVHGRFMVDLEFAQDVPEGIRRGQTFRVRLELSELSQAILLANGSHYQTTGGRWIYVLDDSGTRAHRREIHLGRQNSDFYEVLDGLEPGERVIVSTYETFGDAEHLILK